MTSSIICSKLPSLACVWSIGNYNDQPLQLRFVGNITGPVTSSDAADNKIHAQKLHVPTPSSANDSRKLLSACFSNLWCHCIKIILCEILCPNRTHSLGWTSPSTLRCHPALSVFERDQQEGISECVAAICC